MNEEEKKLVEKFENLYIKDFNGEPITVDDRLSYIECALITNLIEELDKELNSLKEIEQLHQEENGKLRVELEQEKEKNKKLKKENEELDQKFKYAVPDEIVDELYISKDKIKDKIKKLDIEIQQCQYEDDDIEEYKNDMKKEKSRLLRDKKILQELLEENNEM